MLKLLIIKKLIRFFMWISDITIWMEMKLGAIINYLDIKRYKIENKI